MRPCLALLLSVLSLPLSAAQLTLDLGNGSRQWQTEALLKHPQAQAIRIDQDVSYKRPMTYRAMMEGLQYTFSDVIKQWLGSKSWKNSWVAWHWIIVANVCV